MGSCFSCRRSIRIGRRWLSSSSSPSPSFEGVRLVHLSGYVEEFDKAITVRQVTGKPPSNHFVCSTSNLLSFGSKPLSLDTELRPGNLYFLLPHSIFHSDSSPLDFVSLATRLTAIAMRGPPLPPKTSRSTINAFSTKGTTGRPDPDEYHHLMSPSHVLQSWKPVLETIEEKSFDLRSAM